ncbi:PREDICTED: equatorin [Elephantulus edwardii]|uniref:equatorin n=1 Tax=Elephantulus edwardii TaxID=28737 RepID=UPI0003F0BF05|nr:PREDICTED: equatorin [Elephantulus edwardii]
MILYNETESSPFRTGSDLKPGNEETLEQLEDLKLKLMLGISMMSLFLFLVLLIFCFAVLYKLKKLTEKECSIQYSINPQHIEMAYFQATGGVSDTSFPKGAESNSGLCLSIGFKGY